MYRYFSDVDSVKFYFIRVTPGMIVNSEKLTPNITADFDEEDRIVALEILSAQSMTPCHFYDCMDNVESAA